MLYKQIAPIDGTNLMDELTGAAKDGTLTTAQLSAAVMRHIDVSDYIPESIGFKWIRQHPDLFAKHIADTASFLLDHLDVAYMGELLTVSKEVLAVVPATQRAGLIREAVLRCGTRNSRWVQVAIELDVPREALAEIVLEKLRRTTVDLDSSCTNFIQYDFLKYGSGRIERANPLLDSVRELCGDGEAARLADGMSRTPGFEDYGTNMAARLPLADDDPWQWRFDEPDTLWSVLTDDQFVEAILIIIDKAPNLLFEGPTRNGPGCNEHMSMRQKLRMRLTAERMDALLIEAANKLGSLTRVSLDELCRLSPTIQLQVARRLNGGSLGLIVRLALMLGHQGGGKKLLDEFPELFTSPPRWEGHSVSCFRSLWEMLQWAEDKIMAQHIVQRLLEWTKAEGYLYGQVTEGKYRDRRTQQWRRQMQIVCGRTTYIQDRYQNRYSAKVGDWVFVQPARGRQLTPRVMSVVFIPAHSTDRYDG